MNIKLKELYQNKLIEDVSEYSDNYYYFYKTPALKEVFGVSKNISLNEYKLLKEMYIEKKIYTLDKNLQKVYEYVLDNGKYPFKNKKIKMIIYSLKEDDENIVFDLFSSIYKSYSFIKLYNLSICFFEENDTKASTLLETLSSDLGYDIIVHDGIYLNAKVKGSTIVEYVDAYRTTEKINHKIYSDFAEMLLVIDVEKHLNLLKELKINVFDEYFMNQNVREIIEVMFKNDLNVSLSAKLLYMNRNSLINKIDTIYKDTGLNLQKFKHACFVYFVTRIY